MPYSETGDYSDVYVVTPSGKIAWKDVSKISDNEMKELIIEVVNKTYSFLLNMYDDDFLKKSLNISRPFTKQWDIPKLVEGF